MTQFPAASTLLRPEDAARRIGVSTRTLAAWRSQCAGPAWVRLSARVIRYDVDDLDQWVAERLVEVPHPKEGR